MKKFFFDDKRDVPADDWVLARTVDDAKRILTEQAFDVVSLDHDIEYEMMCEECLQELDVENPEGGFLSDAIIAAKLQEGCKHKPDGTTLAHWMVSSMKQPWPKLIIIHSANAYGATRMMGILKSHAKVLRAAYDKARLNSVRYE